MLPDGAVLCNVSITADNQPAIGLRHRNYWSCPLHKWSASTAIAALDSTQLSRLQQPSGLQATVQYSCSVLLLLTVERVGLSHHTRRLNVCFMLLVCDLASH